jgi:hypothetical protein
MGMHVEPQEVIEFELLRELLDRRPSGIRYFCLCTTEENSAAEVSSDLALRRWE